MAGILKSFFCSVFTSEDTSNHPASEEMFDGTDKLESVQIPIEKVTAKLKKLKPSSAQGLTEFGQWWELTDLYP